MEGPVPTPVSCVVVVEGGAAPGLTGLGGFMAELEADEEEGGVDPEAVDTVLAVALVVARRRAVGVRYVALPPPLVKAPARMDTSMVLPRSSGNKPRWGVRAGEWFLDEYVESREVGRGGGGSRPRVEAVSSAVGRGGG